MEQNNSGDGIFIVKKFLCYFSLRVGAIIISWSTFLYSFSLLVASAALFFQHGSSMLILLIPIITLMYGTLFSVRVLCNFPIPDQKYPIVSENARSLSDFMIYNIILVVLYGLGFVIMIIHLRFSMYLVILIILTGLQTYIAAVIYSYYLTITKTEENIYDLVSNEFNHTTSNENSLSNVPYDLKAEPVYAECATLVNNQTYEMVTMT